MNIKTIDTANALQWQPAKRGRYEVWYLTLNNLATKTGYWIRYTITAPQADSKKRFPNHQITKSYCQVWFSFFNYENPDKNFGVTQYYPIEALKTMTPPFELYIDQNYLATGKASGTIESKEHAVHWNLKFEPSREVFFHFPKLLYKLELTDTTVLSPHLDTRFDGIIEIDGRSFELNNDPGDQTHLWGKKHAHKWIWAHCNYFDNDETAVFEAVVAQVKRLNIMLPPIPLFYLKFQNAEYHFFNPNEILFSRSSYKVGEWHAQISGITIKVDIEVSCRIEDLIEAEYFDPDGERAYCANTEVGNSTIKVYKRENILMPWKRAATLTSSGTTHVEWGKRKPNTDIKRKISVRYFTNNVPNFTN